MAVTDVEAMNAAHRALGEPNDYVLMRIGKVLHAFVFDADGPYSLAVTTKPVIVDGEKVLYYDVGAVEQNHDRVVAVELAITGRAGLPSREGMHTEAYIVPADA